MKMCKKTFLLKVFFYDKNYGERNVFFVQNVQKLKNMKKSGKISHFENADNFSINRVINIIVNNFVKKVVKSGQNTCNLFFLSI